MAEVVVFHHAQGRTDGITRFADDLRRAGHTVHVPDMYEGRTFDDLDAGIAYASDVGFDTILERGVHSATDLPAALVYIGFSLGVMPAQKLAQTRRGATGAVLVHACIPASEFGGPWPRDVPVQVHGMDADEFFVAGGDLDAARELVSSVHAAELFVYPGDRHLFTDDSLPSYDAEAAGVFAERVRNFLRTV
jgi:dienelactone hydrolase